jgi:type I restriction enzyme M protein
MASDIVEVERRLWSIADQLRANSGLKPSEYSRPVKSRRFIPASRERSVREEIRKARAKASGCGDSRLSG